MSGLVVADAVVRFGVGRRALNAVDGVSITVPPGVVVGLVGESGSGKTSLGRACVDLAPLHAGSISIDGQPVGRRRRRGAPMAAQMIYQDPYSSLDPRMSVGASIAESLPGPLRRSRRKRAAEVRRLIEMVNLDPDRAGLLPGHLSGGQRQRVALARALGARPRYLIADEITSALDVSVQGSVLNMLKRLQRELNLGVLFISHNLAVVRYVSDFVAVMYLGQIVEFAEVHQIVEMPQHPYTRELLASARQPGGFRPAATDDAPSVIDADPPDPHEPPSGCRFRTRCPIGPAASPSRSICIDVDPQIDAGRRISRASCHFAPVGA